MTNWPPTPGSAGSTPWTRSARRCASNQLIALTSQQTAKTHQLLAAQYRADALDRARRAAAQEQARAQFRRFIGDGQAYTPVQ